MKPDKSPWEIHQDFCTQQLALSETTICRGSKRDVPQLLKGFQASNRQTFKISTHQGYSFATSLQNCFYFFVYLFALNIAIFSLDWILLLLFYALYSNARKPYVMANLQFIVCSCYQALCQIITELLKEQAIKRTRKMQGNSAISSSQHWCD